MEIHVLEDMFEIHMMLSGDHNFDTPYQILACFTYGTVDCYNLDFLAGKLPSDVEFTCDNDKMTHTGKCTDKMLFLFNN